MDGKSKDWETLKLECELWDRKYLGMKRQGRDKRTSGDRQVGLAHQVNQQEDPPSCPGMPLFPDSGDRGRGRFDP